MNIQKNGFTLIELLVVVAIIGVLATVVLASLGQARERANQRKWLAAVHSMQNALEVHQLDQGTYPSSFEYYPSNTGYEGGRAAFTAQMTPYIDVDNFIDSIPDGLTTFIYYGVYTTSPGGGSAARCPEQDIAADGQTYAITFDTQNLDVLTQSWLYNQAGEYNFYCIHS
jgi:general secretion pathway protein G